MSAPNRRAMLRLAAAVLLFSATTAVAISVVSRRLQRGSREAREIAIAPTAASEGLTFIAGPGRLLIVDSIPEGSRVLVGGTAVGATPWSADWKCDSGDAVEVRIERPGFKTFSTSALCQDGTTRVSATLSKGK